METDEPNGGGVRRAAVSRPRFDTVTLGAASLAFALLPCGSTSFGSSNPSVAASQTAEAPAAGVREEANHAAWDRLAGLDGTACREKLGAAGVRFRAMPDQAEPNEEGCGIPHGVQVTQGPSGIKYSPPLKIDCSLALELPAIERAIQQEAGEQLGSPITRVNVFGSYSCRKVRGGVSGNLSEHAVGNAIDIGGFVPRRGAAISVERDYLPLQAEAPHAKSRFLRAVFRALSAEKGITYVIGPETRADHHDHIHIDRAVRWWQFPFFGG